MAVKIRLKRNSKKKEPFYRIVVTDSRSSRDGKFIDTIGFYKPVPDKNNYKQLVVNTNKLNYWFVKGAIPTKRVSLFLEKFELHSSSV